MYRKFDQAEREALQRWGFEITETKTRDVACLKYEPIYILAPHDEVGDSARFVLLLFQGWRLIQADVTRANLLTAEARSHEDPTRPRLPDELRDASPFELAQHCLDQAGGDLIKALTICRNCLCQGSTTLGMGDRLRAAEKIIVVEA